MAKKCVCWNLKNLIKWRCRSTTSEKITSTYTRITSLKCSTRFGHEYTNHSWPTTTRYRDLYTGLRRSRMKAWRGTTFIPQQFSTERISSQKHLSIKIFRPEGFCFRAWHLIPFWERYWLVVLLRSWRSFWSFHKPIQTGCFKRENRVLHFQRFQTRRGKKENGERAPFEYPPLWNGGADLQISAKFENLGNQK